MAIVRGCLRLFGCCGFGCCFGCCCCGLCCCIVLLFMLIALLLSRRFNLSSRDSFRFTRTLGGSNPASILDTFFIELVGVCNASPPRKERAVTARSFVDTCLRDEGWNLSPLEEDEPLGVLPVGEACRRVSRDELGVAMVGICCCCFDALLLWRECML